MTEKNATLERVMGIKQSGINMSKSHVSRCSRRWLKTIAEVKKGHRI